MTFGKTEGFPELFVLDSTDPAQVKAFEHKVDLATTIFIVSEQIRAYARAEYLQTIFLRACPTGARRQRSRQPFHRGHRSRLEVRTKSRKPITSATSSTAIPPSAAAIPRSRIFGMVPGAVMGLDAPRFLDRADVMAIACSACLPVEKNPGVLLGLILGVAGRSGKDKVTLIASPPIRDFGAWLEQLIAESTGKEGKGLIPVDSEALGKPEVYGQDRVFAYIRTDAGFDPAQDAAIEALTKAGHPVVRISLADVYNLGQEMFRWEIAIAVAIHSRIEPFNQPDVEASKIETRKLTTEYEKNGSLPAETPFFTADGVALYTDDANAKALGGNRSLSGLLRAHLNRLGAGDYFGLLAYVEMNGASHKTLQEIRLAVRNSKRVATCLGFGPRFLHSTGQAAARVDRKTQVCSCKSPVTIPPTLAASDRSFTFGG